MQSSAVFPGRACLRSALCCSGYGGTKIDGIFLSLFKNVQAYACRYGASRVVAFATAGVLPVRTGEPPYIRGGPHLSRGTRVAELRALVFLIVYRAHIYSGLFVSSFLLQSVRDPCPRREGCAAEWSKCVSSSGNVPNWREPLGQCSDAYPRLQKCWTWRSCFLVDAG